jgi:8-oxo-dGTP pyrophosphatase MutT (NUDIX family)
MLPKGFLPPDQHYLRLAKKPVSGGVIYRDKLDRILLVKQTYSEFWTIPGGSSTHLESPKECARREVAEELGIKLPVGRLLLLEYHNRHGERDFLHFIFDGGVISQKQIDQIVLQADEIEAFGFFDLKQAKKIMSQWSKERIKFILEALVKQKVVYLENGKAH